MASRIRFRRFYECDTESDRSLDFGADSLLYCLDTQKYYRIYNSSYQEVQPDEVIFISPIPVSKLGISGIPDGTKFLRDDGSWSSVPGGANVVSGVGTAGQVTYWTGTNTISGDNNLFWDSATYRLGVGTNTPTSRIDVRGLTLTDSTISVQGSLNIDRVSAPSAIGGYTLSAGTSLGVGTYYYFVAYVTALGETNAGSNFTVVTTTGNTTVNLTGIPVSTDPRVTARKLYRTPLNSSVDNHKFLATINDNVTTTYIDSIADASLTGNGLQYYKVNTTSRYIRVSGSQGMILDTNLTAIGVNAGQSLISSNSAAIRTVLVGTSAGQSITTGTANVIVGVAGVSINTGGSNTLIGDLAGYVINSGSSNFIGGGQAGRFLTTGSNNTFIGAGSGMNLTTTSNNTALGTAAGRYAGSGTTANATSSNSLYLGYQTRAGANGNTNEVVIGYDVVGLGSNTTILGNSSTVTTAIYGNLLLGSTTDGGQRLQVTGDSLLKGSGNTSGTTALTVQNSDGTTSFDVLNDGVARFRTTVRSTNGGSQLNIFTTAGTGTENGLSISATQSPASGERNMIRLGPTFQPTSGGALLNFINCVGTINQTGGANGITRGLYVNPTLTAAADWRSIEWSNTSGWGLYGAGTANNYLSGELRINETASTNAMLFASTTGKTNVVGVRVGGSATQSSSYGFFANQTINSTTTTEYISFTSSTDFSNATYTVPNVTQFYATSGTKPGTVTITNMYGFRALDNLIQGTNNYGFFGAIPSGTGRWNLYMNGTAANYLAGSLGIGTTSLTGVNLNISKNLTGALISKGISLAGQIQSDSTNGANYIEVVSSTQATAFSLSGLSYYIANQGTFGVGSTVSEQNGFHVFPSLIGANLNIGFRGRIPSGSNRWNLYMDGTAANYLNGELLIGSTTDTGEKLQVNGTAKISTINNATTDTDRFLVSDSGVIKYRTGSELLSDIGGQSALPSQTGNGGKYLTTDGSTLSWQAVETYVKRNIESFIASASQTVFTTVTSTTGNQIDVYINGSRLSSAEFYVSGANQVTINTGTRAGDIVDIVLLLAATDIPNPGTGSSAPNVIFVSTNYTPSVTDDALLVNTTMGNSITITLPLTTASNQDGYHIKNIGPGTVIIIGTSGQQIDQQISISISPGSLSSVYIVPYNNNWYII